jgi:hypothetical protein
MKEFSRGSRKRLLNRLSGVKVGVVEIVCGVYGGSLVRVTPDPIHPQHSLLPGLFQETGTSFT